MKNITANYHTHTTFCDGKNTPEEVVLSAIEKEFSAIGFSSHGYTDFDLRYCMKDTAGYIAEINRLKVKYKDKIQIYLGLEEDAFCHANRESFDYIIGSSHYFLVDGKYYPIDSSYDYFKKCLELFGYDVMKMTHSYYIAFCDYITKRKPDIVGHFDLITKFDELDTSLFLENREYVEAAKNILGLRQTLDAFLRSIPGRYQEDTARRCIPLRICFIFSKRRARDLFSPLTATARIPLILALKRQNTTLKT
jgi:HisJ family histidinol phosphate phosphatase